MTLGAGVANRLLTDLLDRGQARRSGARDSILVQKSNTPATSPPAAIWGVVNARALWQFSLSQLKGEFTMSFKKASVAALLAASMSSAPVMAQTAASASVPAVRAGESTDSASELRGGFIIPLVAVVAIILGILAATGGSNDRPTSP